MTFVRRSSLRNMVRSDKKVVVLIAVTVIVSLDYDFFLA